MAVTITQFKTVMVVVAAGLLFINIFIFYLYNSLLNYYSARMEKQVLEQKIEVYEHQLDLVQESQERVRELCHDMKHHMIELTAMAKGNGNREMVQYLESMKEFMLNPEEYVSTGNEDIDGILNYLLRGAKEALKQVDIKISIPERIYAKNFNICVILGNLVDNAIQAASNSEEKYLSIQMQERQEVLFIFIENSYSGVIIEENSKIKTTQQNPSIHGMGLESVKKVVASNGGEIKIAYTEERFRVQVLLYLSNII